MFFTSTVWGVLYLADREGAREKEISGREAALKAEITPAWGMLTEKALLLPALLSISSFHCN